MRREYKNLQFRTVPEIGIWSRLSQKDLDRLEKPKKGLCIRMILMEFFGFMAPVEIHGTQRTIQDQVRLF